MFIAMNALAGLIIAYLALGSNGLPRPLIIGGGDAPIGLYRYQASLRYEDTHFCNAAIISERYLITVAQCVYGNINPYAYSVMVGSNRLGEAGVIYEVESTVVHDGYNKAQHMHDIALVRVDRNMTFDENTQLIALPDVDRDYDDYPLTVTGWANNNLSFVPYPLQETLVQGYSRKMCNVEYGFIQESQICSKCVEEGQGLCDGDFGDPVVTDGVLVGLVSHVRCDHLHPDISTKIFPHKPWILRNMVN